MLISDIFKPLLFETFKNPHSLSDKEKYVDEVWDILQKSYAKVGGLKTNGLQTKEGLIKNTAFWKLFLKDGKIKVVFIYKDKSGRKKIAIGTDGTKEGKDQLIKMLIPEFERSYSEISDDFEAFIVKNLPDLVKQYQIPFEEVQKIITDEEIKPVKGDKYHFQREISGHWHTKLMIGKPNKKIKSPQLQN